MVNDLVLVGHVGGGVHCNQYTSGEHTTEYLVAILEHVANQVAGYVVVSYVGLGIN
jgi:hypothetical protein